MIGSGIWVLGSMIRFAQSIIKKRTTLKTWSKDRRIPACHAYCVGLMQIPINHPQAAFYPSRGSRHCGQVDCRMTNDGIRSAQSFLFFRIPYPFSIPKAERLTPNAVPLNRSLSVFRHLASSIEYPASIPNAESRIPNAFTLYRCLPSLPASRPPSFPAYLPTSQQILPFLPGGFFLELVKPCADNGGYVRYDRIPHISIFIQ